MKDIIPLALIEKKIYLVRGQKVMLDRDLAELYGVETRALNQTVRRNSDRFPADFMFALDREEIVNISQIVISSAGTTSHRCPSSRPQCAQKDLPQGGGILRGQNG